MWSITRGRGVEGVTLGRVVRLWAPLGILVLATTAAAGASVATSPTTTAPTATGFRVWDETSPVSDPNEAAAMREARRLMGVVKAPKSWTRVSSPPAKTLDAPDSYPGTPNLVDVYELWRTPGTWPTVEARIVAHPPAGSTHAGSGTLSVRGTVLSSSTSYAFPATANHVSSRQLLLEVAPLPGGDVGIRMDAQVIWYPSRSRAELVPRGTTKVTAMIFRRSDLPDSTTMVLATATFTSSGVVKRLVRRVDSLPVAIPGTKHCPEDSGTDPQLELVFSGGPHVPKVVVGDDPNGCGGVSFVIGRTAEAPLTDDGLFQEVKRLPGLDVPTTDDDR